MAEHSRVAYVVNNAAFFVSHRLPLALGALSAGFEVMLFTGQAGSERMESAAVAQLAVEGIDHRRTISRSAGLNPLVELLGMLQLIWFMIRYKPDVMHCASPKGVLYGGIAARICRVQGLVLAISGMGYAFTNGTDQGVARKVIKRIYSGLARVAFRHPNLRIIVQNEDDRTELVQSGWAVSARVTLIPGSGVDLTLFDPFEAAGKKPIVLLPARMLKDKGVLEFVAAASQLKTLVPEWQFVLAGAAGYDNPTAIAQADLERWQAEGVVQWLGHIDNMVPLFNEASIVCLPSYREGMPKALLEAAAAGCAVVTTDVAGCREAIVPGTTGDLVPVRDVDALVVALFSLIKDDSRRQAYGEHGRQRAMARFSVESVVQQTTDIYKELLNDQIREAAHIA